MNGLLSSVMCVQYSLCQKEDSLRMDPSRCFMPPRSDLNVTSSTGRPPPSKFLFREGATGRGGAAPIRIPTRSAVRVEELPLSIVPPAPSPVWRTSPWAMRVRLPLLSIPLRFEFSFRPSPPARPLGLQTAPLGSE
jgi:hypothetical protein